MLTWALTFFVIAVISAIFAFLGLVGTAAGIAKIIFFACLLFLFIFIIGTVVQNKKSKK